MTSVLVRGEKRKGYTEANACGDRGIDWKDASVNQGLLAARRS